MSNSALAYRAAEARVLTFLEDGSKRGQMTSLYLAGTSTRLYHEKRRFWIGLADPDPLFGCGQELVNTVQLVFRAEINLNDPAGPPADDPDPGTERKAH